MKLGRNDPCFCGSGKKYKRCCLGKARSGGSPTGARVLPEANPPDDASAISPFSTEPPDVMSPDYWNRLEKQLPRKLRNENAGLFKQVKAYAAFEAQKPEIEAAHEALEKYRKKFERLTRNTGKFLKRAEKLFAEEPFEAMRFGAGDLQRAFESVGYPPSGASGELYFENMQKTIEFLVDGDEREVLARQLIQLLPDYVAARRHIDAWIIQHSAFLMTEEPSEGCGPFLMCMFMHGMREWENQREREQLNMFHKLGVDPEVIRRRGIKGVESLVQEMMAKKGASEELEQFLNAHPDLKALTEAQCRDSEDAAIKLLQREDAGLLLLAPAEIEPWFPVFEQRIGERPDVTASVDTNEEPDEELQQEFFDLIYATCGEMADEIFTKPRLDRLTDEIHAYRRKLRRKDHNGKNGVHGLLMAAQSSAPPAKNHVLTLLCVHSFMKVMHDMGGAENAE